jgi:O-acetyl-ADP-ribose deacetylase (regulator of RNase III)
MRHEGYVHGFEIDEKHSLHIYQGSLVRVQADALVSSDDNYLSAGGGVSAALAMAAGLEVERERRRIVRERRPELGDVVRTSGGGLPCRYLYHAITINFAATAIDGDRDAYMDEGVLRQLIANLLRQASEDGVRSIGLPALGTGVAAFELGRASEIIIDELLDRLVETPVRRVILALIGDEAERLFHERLVRSGAARLASRELRRRESEFHSDLKPSNILLSLEGGTALVDFGLARRVESDELRPTADGDPLDTPLSTVPEQSCREDGPAALSHLAVSAGHPASLDAEGRDAENHGAARNEVVEQSPKLVDEARLSSTPAGRPRLVAGLADLILEHADPEEIERELLSSPACRGFRGNVKQRLMEYLYLSEENLKKALGPALFKNKDLRTMLKALGEDSDLPRDQGQLSVAILQALCFNTLAPPEGIGECIARLERILADLRGASDVRALVSAAVETGKVLEQVLKDLLRVYGFVFFGGEYEAELVKRRVVPTRRDGSHISRLTIGQALEALEQLDSLMGRDDALRQKWRALGRPIDGLLPRRFGDELPLVEADSRQVLRKVIALRNDSVHTGSGVGADGPEEVSQKVQGLHAFCCACQAAGVYPDVLRYEGTYENRDGERFVYFLDEKGRDRKVRTDERIDARRHYYCFATNNPVHLHPTLIPKLH